MSFITNIHVDQVVSRYIPGSLVDNAGNIAVAHIRPLRIRRPRSPRMRSVVAIGPSANFTTDSDNNVTYTLIRAGSSVQLPIRLLTKEAAASEVRIGRWLCRQV